jgi:TDG/mug DNA glycosylase family protein
MIEYKVARSLRILFVGINPHPGSYRRGVPFSNNKTFWYLLNRSGLLNEDEAILRTDRGLKEMYDERFLPKYRLTHLQQQPRLSPGKIVDFGPETRNCAGQATKCSAIK